MSISISCIRQARYSLIWQILIFDYKNRKLRFELEFEFPFCVITKAVLRRRLLVFIGGPMRLATNFTLVTAQNTRKIDFFFGSEEFSRPTFATSSTVFIISILKTKYLQTLSETSYRDGLVIYPGKQFSLFFQVHKMDCFSTLNTIIWIVFISNKIPTLKSIVKVFYEFRFFICLNFFKIQIIIHDSCYHKR
jgi:hypothetical protein